LLYFYPVTKFIVSLTEDAKLYLFFDIEARNNEDPNKLADYLESYLKRLGDGDEDELGFDPWIHVRIYTITSQAQYEQYLVFQQQYVILFSKTAKYLA
jgi:hypothetical protein